MGMVPTTKVSYPYTDMGNAERLYAKYGVFHWVTERKLFVIWDGTAWVYDTPDNTKMSKFAKLAVRNIIPSEMNPNMPDEDFKALTKFALSSENQNRIQAMIESVKSEGDITISVDVLDKDPYLFNCRNATIDLYTGKARLTLKMI